MTESDARSVATPKVSIASTADTSLTAPNWYEVVTGPELEQGDILPNLDAPRAKKDDNAPGGYVIRPGRGDYVVVSQTCDLENKKLQEVLLADFRDYQSATYSHDRARSRAFRDALIQNSDWAYFLLPEFTGPPTLKWSVVNFHYLFLVDVDSCRHHAEALGRRLRLVSPYKEHLAQSFGRYMMRVALPETANAFAKVEPAPKPSTAPRPRA
ncbi:MAG TPA: hypothetical protein VFQ44_09700 [Streptosporangiaceae bacterium]|nr:hypothetical protein [Streptosporangiaceae bacterium]